MLDTGKLIQSVDNLSKNQSYVTLEEIKNNILSFFPNTKIANIYYTENTDNMPFGVMVTPNLAKDDINRILITGESVKITSCNVEIDSKLFSCGLDASEATAIMIYNIYHMVMDNGIIDRLRFAIDTYFASTKTQLHIRDSIQYQRILEFGLVDTLVKFTNCLYLDSAIVTDSYLDSLELSDSFVTGIRTLFNKYENFTNDASRFPSLVILDWCFRLYADVEHERIPAIKQLERSKELTPSVLYKKIINEAIDALNKIDVDSFVFESYQELLTEGKKGSIFAQIKYNGLRGIEDDFYEFMVRARNAHTEEEVMYALKQINVRLSILDDYIRNENLTDEEKQKWTNLYIKYCNIRDEIANKKVYNKKNYGIFFDYNQLDKMYDDEEDDY